MDLIYMNADLVDIGVLLDYDMDMAFGADENNFECTVSTNNHCCQAGFFLYMDGTEYGGIIDSIESQNDVQEVTYSGRTWHGILNSKVLEPDSGAAYLVCSGEANTVLASLLTRCGLTGLFAASTEASGLTISNYKMNRYITAYDGIIKMLKSVGGKLLFQFAGGKIVISAVSAHDYTQDDEFDSDLVVFDLNKSYKTVNHLICLGQGDLAARTVVHLYADSTGTISKTKTFTGMDEITSVFDYSSAESAEDLESKGIERLQKLWETDSLKIDFDADSDSYDIGDKVGAVDNITGITVSEDITKKIIKIKDGKTTISYKVGE